MSEAAEIQSEAPPVSDRLIFDQAERVGKWVAAKLDVEGFIAPYTALGWENAKGDLTGGIIFNNFTGANVEASVAWDGPVARTMLKHVRKYVFGQHKCRRITIHTRKSRLDVISQAERLGFEPEGFHPGFFADDDGVSLGLLKQNCRW